MSLFHARKHLHTGGKLCYISGEYTYGTCVSIMLFLFLFPINVPFELPIYFPLLNVPLTDITLYIQDPLDASSAYDTFTCMLRFELTRPTSYYKTLLLLQDPPLHAGKSLLQFPLSLCSYERSLLYRDLSDERSLHVNGKVFFFYLPFLSDWFPVSFLFPFAPLAAYRCD